MLSSTRYWLNNFRPTTQFLTLARMSSTHSAAPTPPAAARSRSPPSSPEQSNKRLKLDETAAEVAAPTQPKASTSKLPYSKGLHLAPMVRIGTLPTRLMSLEYGAELVWGPEIVDKAIIGSTREVDPVTGVVRFMKKDRSIFECHPLEKSRVIFQLGSADPDLAVQAAKMVQNDVAGIGLNCGCPKPFSISGGMGAALMHVPDKLCAILRALVANVPLPIDVKTRMFPEQAPTLEFVSELLDTGVSNLTMHCRTQSMRSSEPALLDRLAEITALGRAKGIPVVANGDCVEAADFDKICALTGVSSIMVARGAEANPSCFRKEGMLDPLTIIAPLYVKLAIATGNHFHNTKYCLGAMDPSRGVDPTGPGLTKAARGAFKLGINKSKTLEDIAKAVGVDFAEAKKFEGRLEELVPAWAAKAKAIAAEEAGEGVAPAEVAEAKVEVVQAPSEKVGEEHPELAALADVKTVAEPPVDG